MLLMQSKVALDAAANVFYEYSQGDPKAKVLSPKCFVFYSKDIQWNLSKQTIQMKNTVENNLHGKDKNFGPNWCHQYIFNL